MINNLGEVFYQVARKMNEAGKERGIYQIYSAFIRIIVHPFIIVLLLRFSGLISQY